MNQNEWANQAIAQQGNQQIRHMADMVSRHRRDVIEPPLVTDIDRNGPNFKGFGTVQCIHRCQTIARHTGERITRVDVGHDGWLALLADVALRTAVLEPDLQADGPRTRIALFPDGVRLDCYCDTSLNDDGIRLTSVKL